MDLFSLRFRLARLSRQLAWAPLAVLRFTLGGLFVGTGWGKVHHLAKVASYFTELHIPSPSFCAALVAWSELLCGALLLAGLFSRLATIPLIVTMVVALATAKHGDIHGLSDLFGQVEFTYLCMLFVLLVMGPGAASLDGLMARLVERRRGVRVLPEPVVTGEPSHGI